MIKKISITIALMLFLTSPSLAAHRIKVLILDEGFDKIPQPKEELTRVESIDGSLKLGDSNYTGLFEVWRGAHGIYLINDLPLEKYVEGVVKAETGKDWAQEALRAQAVIVRTYVLKQKLNNLGRKYDVTSSVLHQVYKGQNLDNNVSSAVKTTKGQILTYDGEPIMAYYHSTSSGKTELPEEIFGKEYPYLKSVLSSGRLSPLSIWSRRISFAEIERATGTSNLSNVVIKTRTLTGRAKEIALLSPTSNNTKLSNHTIGSNDLRKALGWRRLPSTDFKLSVQNKTVAFEGRGYGHGVGLCQWTALEMAIKGMQYREILSYFYPGTRISSDADIKH